MGKAARRSVASDPSSPTLSFLQRYSSTDPAAATSSTDAKRTSSPFSSSPFFFSSNSSPASSSPYRSPRSSSAEGQPQTTSGDSGSSSSSSSDYSDEHPLFEPEAYTPSPPLGTSPEQTTPKFGLISSTSSSESSLDTISLASSSSTTTTTSTQAPTATSRTPSTSVATPTTLLTTAASIRPSSTTSTASTTIAAVATLKPSEGTPPSTTASPASTGSPGTSSTPSLSLPSSRLCSNQTQADRDRERLRMEFYATYDVMTGVRIAATLGGFFGLMVFLVIYKSRSRSTTKALKDPTIAAVAAAVIQEEEERELQEAIEATAFSLLQEELHINFPGLKRDRLMSLGNVSAPPMLNRPHRFSSVGGGGYSSLLNPPPRRYSYASSRGHRNSVSVSSRVLSAMGESFGQDDYFLESDGEEADDEFDQFTTTADVGYPPGNFLAVPGRGTESRRSSAMTCCSTESSFLERRCSAITLGLSSLSRSPSRQQSRDDPRSNGGPYCGGGTASAAASAAGATCADWDAFYPGINIIEATPKSSPCPSERVAHRGTTTATTTGSLCARELFSGIGGSGSSRRHQYQLYDDSSIDCISEYPVETDVELGQVRSLRHKNYHSSSSRVDEVSIANHRNPVAVGIVGVASGSGVRRAPLASLSSFKMSSADGPDSDQRSCGSDSVFDESCADTDEDLQQFSTDSDELSIPDDEEEEVQQVQRSRPAVAGPSNQQQQTGASSSSGGGGVRASDSIYVDIEKPNDTSCLSSLSNRSKLKPDNSRGNNLVTRIETKAIIERQQQNDSSSNSRDRSPSPRSTATTVLNPPSSVSSSAATTIAVSHNSKDNNNTSTSSKNSKHHHTSSKSKNDDNSNQKQVERDPDTNNKCVEVNVIIKNHSQHHHHIKSPSVILELPILTIDEDSSQSPLSPVDPCVPGPSRKWSKETLF
ncbi:serine-rich adhesin for platelets isoform X1 [Culex quinquefasciatus]|uniref:serine-rich adhesin for platelets isoform X1 n=1 Tax=Culex quinquefasciatus TaxID=7176 RepID=UPI0018E316C8|nr:serine-rich adhesin for platelets isoform X1 [Culex quinquefasciatus]XP_038108292.1 serine-rich adhesin for platelets isoform X1 [Culex quinquefasciatus]XP_038108294.1 serine-rich adhesin for platelets isoform X1 [Culex quinquefasciatus]XP_038108295.1 serine-rich adhesin for platelets isoform X1 [Culex quinquefasciatus]XP_038108296.1 serine-rich adhesin for platelets isoform X1 [Culex quinquefasciatus]